MVRASAKTGSSNAMCRWQSEIKRSSGGALEVEQFYGSARGDLDQIIDEGVDVIITRSINEFLQRKLSAELLADRSGVFFACSYGTLGSEYSRLNSGSDSDEAGLGLHSSKLRLYPS